MNSVVIVQNLQKNRHGNVAGWSPIQKIKDLVALEWEVGIKHVYQEPNKCADDHVR